MLETAWREIKLEDPEAAAYETAVSDLCRYAIQATGVQEQLPVSLKHGGDIRPWTSTCRRAESVEKSYETLVSVLTTRSKLELVAKVNRSLNAEILKITECVKEVFEALETNNTPTLQLVVPSYYLQQRKLQPGHTESGTSNLFRSKLQRYLDEKFWPSITALHWIACFLDPSFKSMQFIPHTKREDIKFKRELDADLDTWILDEMCKVEGTLTDRTASCSDDRGFVFTHDYNCCVHVTLCTNAAVFMSLLRLLIEQFHFTVYLFRLGILCDIDISNSRPCDFSCLMKRLHR